MAVAAGSMSCDSSSCTSGRGLATEGLWCRQAGVSCAGCGPTRAEGVHCACASSWTADACSCNRSLLTSVTSWYSLQAGKEAITLASVLLGQQEQHAANCGLPGKQIVLHCFWVHTKRNLRAILVLLASCLQDGQTVFECIDRRLKSTQN